MCIGSVGVDFRYMFALNSRCVYKYIKTNAFLREFLAVILSDIFRDYENKLHEKLSIPKIGEGWVSETQLYNMIKGHFKNTEVIHQGQPKWLGKQRFDIYLPEYNIAIEYQGAQHFKPVKIFGGEEGYKRIVENDKRKKQLCEKNDCVLIYVTENYNPNEIIEKINNIINSRQTS